MRKAFKKITTKIFTSEIYHGDLRNIKSEASFGQMAKFIMNSE